MPTAAGWLDRRTYARLGPDGDGIGPSMIVGDIATVVWEGLREIYPTVTYEIGKRAIVFSFHEPIDDEDPSVDLIVGLTRLDKPGLWIPNTERDGWDASHPEEHTRLLTAPPKDLRVHRARLVRLAKVAVEQDGDKAVIISFNVEALALEHVTETNGLAEGLRDFLWAASADIAHRLTTDPAHVSPPIKLPPSITQAQASRRLRFLGDRLAEAIERRYDEQRVLEALGDVFPEQLPDAPRAAKADFARALRGGNVSQVQAGVGAGAERLRNTRSYGGDAPE